MLHAKTGGGMGVPGFCDWACPPWCWDSEKNDDSNSHQPKSANDAT